MVLVKSYLIRLKHIFAFKKIKKQVHYLLLYVITLIYLIVKNSYLLVILIILLLVLFFIYNRTLLYYSLCISLVIVPYIIINNCNFNKICIDVVNDYGKVYKVVSYDDYDKVYIKINKVNFFFNTNDNLLSSGDKVYIKGKVKILSKSHYENGFNYYDYLRYQNIYGQIVIEEVKLINKGFGINIFHEKVNNYIRIKFNPTNAQIIQALIIGEKHNLDEELNEDIKGIGISHLFVISGLHVELINKTIDKFLTVIKMKEKYKNIIILLFQLFYYVLTSLLVSILRVIIGFVLSKFLKNIVKELTTIDKLSLNAIIVLLINPYNLFSYSFLLSYMIVFGILLISPKLKKEKGIKNFIINNLFISFTSTIISLPIIVRISSDINILSILFNLFFIPFVSYILLPLTFIVFVIPGLEFIYSFIVNFFIGVTRVLSNIDIFTISFSFIPLVLVIIFYILFILVFMNKGYKYKKIIRIVFILYIVFLYYLPYFNNIEEVSFLDLPSGDATFIHTSYNKKNILIDTGDVDASMIISFLKTKGVKNLDAVIISHGDSDHIGGLISLNNEFKIKSLFISYYDSVSVNEIKNYNLSNIQVYYLKEGDEFYIDKLYFKVLWPGSNQFDVNNNSLVIYSEIFNTRFLFTGDIEKEAENGFVKKYKNLCVDVLKVAHHGSKTSSTIEFLNCVKFTYAVSMNGYSNTYNFPHKIVVDRINGLDNVIMLNTLDFGTITFYRKNRNSPLKIKVSFNS
ncbi:MAG: DNA internalization-related competence protein ComEC/Rec2 [Erysipelotrichaceae bacterium]|nr:DNA internalization-related competence protein ComEC/Rec2 [Erysipelotrichaceae bacterium]